jgi:type II secretory pathway pseudopilin PulG
MKNKYKGFTLIETMLYIGLFSIIIIMVVSFMLSTQRSTVKTESQENIFRSSQFISQHIKHSISEADSLDESNTVFNDDNGTISLILSTDIKIYELQDQRLYFDNTLISNSDILITKFFVTPLYDELDIVGVKVEIELLDKSDQTITDTINILELLK